MKLSAFEAHPMWATVDQGLELLAAMRAEDDGSNVDALEELETHFSYLKGLYRARNRSAPLVFSQQLDNVNGNLTPAVNSLSTASSQSGSMRTQYLQQAQQYLPGAFMQLGHWGTLVPTSKEARLEIAVVDELLRYNERVDSERRKRLEALTNQTSAIGQRLDEVEDLVATSKKEISSATQDAKQAIDSERVRIGAVIDDGRKTIAGFEGELNSSVAEWQAGLAKKFAAGLADLRRDQEQLLDAARAQYAELQETTEGYQSIVQADSADRLAKHYELESKSSKTAGWVMLVFGIVVLLGAAVPLLLVVLHPYLNQMWDWSLKEPDWPSLTARAGLAAVLAAAATVAIRMGSGFHRRSDQYKRLAMELRTMGPFLSTVSDTESVDQARLDLVNRAFGQGYGAQPETKTETDTVPVTLLQQIFTMVSRVSK